MLEAAAEGYRLIGLSLSHGGLVPPPSLPSPLFPSFLLSALKAEEQVRAGRGQGEETPPCLFLVGKMAEKQGVEPGSEKKAQEPNAEEGMGLKAGPG